MSYYNADGLLLKYGTAKATATTAGDYKTNGANRQIEVRIDLSTMTNSPVIQNDVTFMEKMRIESVDIEVQTAAVSSGSGTLDVGFIKTDRSTELDYNGLIAAELTSALDTAGKKITYINGTSKAGALIGTTLTDIGYITANRNTADFQSGIVYVRINYRPN